MCTAASAALWRCPQTRSAASCQDTHASHYRHTMQHADVLNACESNLLAVPSQESTLLSEGATLVDLTYCAPLHETLGLCLKLDVDAEQVYGETSVGKESGCTETSTLEPTNPYSAAKAGAGVCPSSHSGQHHGCSDHGQLLYLLLFPTTLLYYTHVDTCIFWTPHARDC